MNSKHIKFTIVDVPANHPNLLGCRAAIDLGIITVNLDSVSKHTPSPNATETLSRDIVLTEYSGCFDKIGRFPGEQYHIKLVDNPKFVIHAPRTVPVHIMPLYCAKLEK